MPEIKLGWLDEDRFERSRRLGWFDLDKVGRSSVLVVGVGAIGNEVVKNLVYSGFSRLTLVDMDRIVKSNLNRCLYFSDEDAEAKKYKAEVVAARLKEEGFDVVYHTSPIQDLGEDFISHFDIVFGCLDNLLARYHLNSHCYFYKIPYIDGGTLGLLGKVQAVLPPSSCLQCNANKTHTKIVNERFSCTGEQTTFFEPKFAAEITTTSIVASVQVREALKILNASRMKEELNKKWKLTDEEAQKKFLEENTLLGKMFYYDGVRNVSDTIVVPFRQNCSAHGQMDDTE
jgi:molybdopterin/thiamine biosynthesis adenylyltransferase